MRKICIQSGHWGVTTGATGAPREQERTIAIGLKLYEKLKALGVEAYRDDAFDDNDPYVNNTDWDLYLSLHCDANYEGNEGGGFIDWIDPSIDSSPQSNAESKRIAEAIEAVYFKESGVRNVPSRRNANTKFYYMWYSLSANTHCAIIEMGESIDPHDNVILNDTERQASILLKAIQNAFPDLKTQTTTQVPPTNEVDKLKAEITRLNDIIGKVKDPQIKQLEKDIENVRVQCALDVKTAKDQRDSIHLQLIECQRQSDIYKVEYDKATGETGYKVQINELERQKNTWVEAEKTFNRQIGQLQGDLKRIKSPIKQILLSILDELKALTVAVGSLAKRG